MSSNLLVKSRRDWGYCCEHIYLAGAITKIRDCVYLFGEDSATADTVWSCFAVMYHTLKL